MEQLTLGAECGGLRRGEKQKNAAVPRELQRKGDRTENLSSLLHAFHGKPMVSCLFACVRACVLCSVGGSNHIVNNIS